MAAFGRRLGLYSTARSVLWALSGFPGDRYLSLLTRSEHWPRETLLEFRDDKLRRLLAHCYDAVPYYRRVMDSRRLTPADIRGVADLGKLPPLTKATIRAHGADLMARTLRSTPYWSKTGGTTGEPMRIAKTKECTAWEGMCFERGLSWGGLGVNEPRTFLKGGSLGLGRPTAASRAGRLLRRDLFLKAFELRDDTAGDYIRRIRASGHRFILGYASAIFRLATLSDRVGERIKLDAVFPTAEATQPEWEEVIRRAFQCAVLPYYGCGEVNSLAFKPGDRLPYCISDEHAVIEIGEDRGESRLDGEGPFLVTDLDNYAMPLLRYRNGDAGKLRSHGDGDRPFTQIERLDGRYNSFLLTDKGELISGAIGPHVFREVRSVEKYQIVQEEPRRIVIRVVPAPEYSMTDEEFFVSLFSKYLGSGVRISVEQVQDISPPPSGKVVFVINRCLDEASVSGSEPGPAPLLQEKESS
jgi:phenylacetate-coenzyme A ligase PaaK-like adenylate-forming protein